MRRDPATVLFRILGVPLRLVMLQRVARRASTATELARQLPVSRTAVVQHLGVLRRHGLVDTEVEGRNRIDRAIPEGLAPLGSWLRRHGGLPCE